MLKWRYLIYTTIVLTTAAMCQAEFQVNTNTNGLQEFPDIATDSNDNFVVVWRSKHTGSRGIYGQRFGSDGPQLGGDFQINTTSVGGRTHYGPSVGMDSWGNFVVAWSGYNNGEESIIARRFDANAAPLSDEFVVNTNTHSTFENSHLKPSIAMNPSGAFVIVWAAWHGDDHHNGEWGVYGRAYNAVGVPRGDEFVVTQLFHGYSADVAIDSVGDFVVTWYCKPNQAPYGDNIQFRRYNANGTAKDNAVQITDSYLQVSDLYVGPSIAMDGDGNFVVAWSDVPNVAYAYDIWFRRFNASGTAISNAQRANTYTDGYQWEPSISMNNDGEFVVVWWGTGIKGQRYSNNGVPVGDEFQIHTYVAGSVKDPAVEMKNNGEFITVWQSDGQDGDNYGVFGEFGPKICCADFSGDLFVNFRDFAFLAEEWLQEDDLLQADLIDDNKTNELDLTAFSAQWLAPCYQCSEADIYEDGIINFKDYRLLMNDWLKQGPLFGDMTGEGTVDMSDLKALVFHWLENCD